MTLTTAGPRNPKASELQAQISELEDQYAEMFLINAERELLKKIHLRLEILKQELKYQVQMRW